MHQTLSDMEILRAMVGQPPEVPATRAGGTYTHTGTETDTDTATKQLFQPQTGIVGLSRGHEAAEDTIYYRTKWPWPFKDRGDVCLVTVRDMYIRELSISACKAR
jgi:hypothetical protein